MCKNCNCLNGCITSISVTLNANGVGVLPVNNTLEKAKISKIGIRRPTGAAGSSKDSNGNAIISQTAFDSAFLTLKKGATASYDNTPLAFFQQTTNCCDMKCVNLPDGFDSNMSQVKVSDASLITAGQVIELTFEYECNC